MTVKSATFRGKKFDVYLVQKLCGLAESNEPDDDEMIKSSITISEDQTPLQFLDTTIHESLHACLWRLSEEDVTQTATDIARLLWRMGYRRKQEP